MRKQLFFAGLTLVTLAYLTACGDETTNVTMTTGMSVVKKGGKAPDCTADNEGEMVYLADSAAAFFCADGKWLSLKGEKGEPGEAGEGKQGPQGPKGEDGVGTKGDPGAAGESCTAHKLASDNGYKIVCGGDSVGVVKDGEKGDPGVGSAGAPGTSCSATQETGGVRITCTDSTSFLLPNGNDGTSCSATQVTGGVQIECTDGSSVTVKDGANGADGKSFVDGWMVDPRDKQLYRTVTIGDKIWMAENLNFAYTAPTKDSLADSSSFCHGNDPVNCAKYGRFYLWSAAMDSAGVIPGNTPNGCGYESICSPTMPVRGVCPPGWHLPSREEFRDLIAMAYWTNSGWNPMNAGYYDAISIRQGVLYYAGGSHSIIGRDYFWSSTESDEEGCAEHFACPYVDQSIDLDCCDGSKFYAFSVRCIKDVD